MPWWSKAPPTTSRVGPEPASETASGVPSAECTIRSRCPTEKCPAEGCPAEGCPAEGCPAEGCPAEGCPGERCPAGSWAGAMALPGAPGTPGGPTACSGVRERSSCMGVLGVVRRRCVGSSGRTVLVSVPRAWQAPRSASPPASRGRTASTRHTSAVAPTDSRSSRDRLTSRPHANPPRVPSDRRTR
ncbi:Cys-every-fifth RiPP peptide CefA [Curtobacterium citreum]|uniref:Cys-every-fifth RiPP peptide CefA n=1 Tax=Curtobacterium citreum TaxID=2036 RepID=UPI003D752080